VKLKQCLCGGNGIINDTSSGDLAVITCDKCGLETLGWAKRKEAAQNWNNICRLDSDQRRALEIGRAAMREAKQ
jgi:hypothetical protein